MKGTPVSGSFLSCLVVLLLLWATLSGCGPASEADKLAAGKTRTFQAGTPEFDIESVPVWTDTGSAVDVYMRIPYSSLTFTKSEKGFGAVADLTLMILDGAGENTLAERAVRETLAVATFGETVGEGSRELVLRIPAPPGECQVRVLVEDTQSRKETRREEPVTVIGRDGGSPVLGKLVIEERRADGTYRPLLRLHVPADSDSLRGAIALYHLAVGDTIPLLLQLRKIPCDTSAAQLPFGYAPIASSYKWSFVDFARPDTLSARSLPVVGRGGRQLVHLALPPLPKGMYELFAELTPPRRADGESPPPQIERRYLLIFPAGFPRPTGAEAYIEPLQYIATEQQMDTLRAPGTLEERKARLERFWRQKMPDMESARATVNRYYQRMVEANRLFTTYKEGWKTDRGMIYMVLGPPVAIQREFLNERWEYDLSRTLPDNFYSFKRVVVEGEQVELRVYVLVRSNSYEQFWYEMTDRWKRGRVF